MCSAPWAISKCACTTLQDSSKSEECPQFITYKSRDEPNTVLGTWGHVHGSFRMEHTVENEWPHLANVAFLLQYCSKCYQSGVENQNCDVFRKNSTRPSSALWPMSRYQFDQYTEPSRLERVHDCFCKEQMVVDCVTWNDTFLLGKSHLFNSGNCYFALKINCLFLSVEKH